MKLSRTKKRVIMVPGIILTLILSFIAVLDLTVPRYETTEKIYYTYKSKGGIDYKVYLRPNIMYNQDYLEKGKYYVFKYIDHVDMNFKYEYASSSSASIKTQYSAVAYLQGLHGDENEVLWSREFILVPDKTEETGNTGLMVEFNKSVDLSEFNTIKESLYIDSEVNAPVVLNVVFKIHTAASTQYGNIEDNISPALIIPIGSSVFKMEGQPEVAAENKISENVRSRIPVNVGKLILVLGFTLVLIVVVIITGIAGEAAPPDAFEKSIANIFKEYSDRLAGMEHTISYEFSDNINVKTIEDMIKIADEVGQPVFYYKVDSSMERKIEFFVFDSNRVYYMVIFGELKPVLL